MPLESPANDMEDSENETPIPPVPSTEERLAALEKSMLDSETKMLEQEHRVIRVFVNLWEFGWRKKKAEDQQPKRKAVWTAFSHWLLGTFLGGAGGGGGLLWSIALGISTAYIAYKAYELSKYQLEIDDGNRKALISEELTSALDEIGQYYMNHPDTMPLPDHIVGRLAGVSQLCKPYRSLAKAGSSQLEDRPYSPERGRLLVTLLAMGPEGLERLLGRCNLRRADISECYISSAALASGLLLSNSTFASSRIEGVRFVDSDFTHVDFTNAQILNASFSYCAFDSSVFRGVHTSNVTFQGCSFRAADLSGFQIDGGADAIPRAFRNPDFKDATLDTQTYNLLFKQLDSSVSIFKIRNGLD